MSFCSVSVEYEYFWYILAYLNLQADQICYAVLCVFSYVAAGMEHKAKEQSQYLEAAQQAGLKLKQSPAGAHT